MAKKLAARLPSSITWQELIAPGAEALLEVIERFDPARGIPFEPYAIRTIRFRLLDALRELGPISRNRQQLIRQVRDWRQEQQRAGCDSGDDAMPAELRERWRRLRPPLVGSLDHPIATYDERTFFLGEQLADRRSDLAMQRDEFWQHILRRLDDRERRLLVLYYRDGWTMREIGEQLGLSEARVSQLHARMLARLKGREQAEDLAALLPPAE